MNPAQGSPATAQVDDLPDDRNDSKEIELQTRDLATPVKRCKTKSLNLPFSVESLISNRAPGRTHYSSDPGLAKNQTEVTVCRSPMGLYAEKRFPLSGGADLSDSPKRETVELSDKEQCSWFQAEFASPPSKCSSIRCPSQNKKIRLHAMGWLKVSNACYFAKRRLYFKYIIGIYHNDSVSIRLVA